MLPHLKTILGTKFLCLSQRYLPLFAYIHAKFERVEVFLKGQAGCLVFQNSSLGCLNIHSSTTPNRVFLKPPYDGVTGHPQNTLKVAVNHSKECYANTSIYHSANSQLYVIVSNL